MDPSGADQSDLDYLLGSVGVSNGLASTAVTSGTPAVGLATQHGGVGSALATSMHGAVPPVVGIPLVPSAARGNPTNVSHLASMRGNVHPSLGAPVLHNLGNKAHLAGDEASANDTTTGTPDSTTTNNNIPVLNHNNDHTATTTAATATTTATTNAHGAHNNTLVGSADALGDNAQGNSSGGGVGVNSKKRPLEDKKARDRKRILRNRQLARVSNERRKGRIKAMENELTETRQTVTTLEESIRCLEEENRELRNLLHGKPDGNSSIAQQPPPPTAPRSIPPPVPPSL